MNTAEQLADEIYGLHCDIGRLETENAKLRELVLILANCAAGHGCDYCPINGGQGYVGELDMCESVHDRMRELGVEVEENDVSAGLRVEDAERTQ